MAAPSGKIPLPPEAYAALGDFRSAIRELTKLKGELETIATQTIAAQGKIDPATKARIDQTKGKIAEYKAQEETRKVAAKEARETTAKTILAATNSHNPHGALRGILSGGRSIGGSLPNLVSTLGGGLQKLGMATGNLGAASAGTSLINAAASVAGPAGIAAFVTHEIMQLAQKQASEALQNANRQKQLAGESLSFTRANRYTSFYSASELTEFQHRKQRAFAEGAKVNQSLLDSMPKIGWATNPWYMWGAGGPGRLTWDWPGREAATARGLESQAAEQERIRIERRLQQSLGKRAAGKTMDPNSFMNDPDVQATTSFKALGATEYFYRRLVNGDIAFAASGGASVFDPGWWALKGAKWVGIIPDYDGNDTKKAAEAKALENGRKVLKEQEDAMKAWFEQPVNRTIAAQFERHSRTVEEFEIERVGKWNPY